MPVTIPTVAAGMSVSTQTSISGMPGGMELAVLFLLFLLLALPVGLIVLAVAWVRRRSSVSDIDARLDRIEIRLDDLEAALEQRD